MGLLLLLLLLLLPPPATATWDSAPAPPPATATWDCYCSSRRAVVQGDRRRGPVLNPCSDSLTSFFRRQGRAGEGVLAEGGHVLLLLPRLRPVRRRLNQRDHLRAGLRGVREQRRRGGGAGAGGLPCAREPDPSQPRGLGREQLFSGRLSFGKRWSGGSKPNRAAAPHRRPRAGAVHLLFRGTF